MRALKALGSLPAVWHLNEGHAAFVVLQRIRDYIEEGLSFDAALEEVRRTTVFTTHTPVPAGHDAFPFNLVENHLAGCWGSLGEYRDRFMQLGAYDNGSGPQFNMTALALRAAKGVNAVSQLHGVVTREMWGPIWPGMPEDARPVRAITNGIHMPTWLSNEMSRLFDDYMPADWRERHDDPVLWARVLDIPDEALWSARNALRHQVMPTLAQHFPGFQQRFARTAQHAQSAQRLLIELAAQDLALCLDGAGAIPHSAESSVDFHAEKPTRLPIK